MMGNVTRKRILSFLLTITVALTLNFIITTSDVKATDTQFEQITIAPGSCSYISVIVDNPYNWNPNQFKIISNNTNIAEVGPVSLNVNFDYARIDYAIQGISPGNAVVSVSTYEDGPVYQVCQVEVTSPAIMEQTICEGQTLEVPVEYNSDGIRYGFSQSSVSYGNGLLSNTIGSAYNYTSLIYTNSSGLPHNESLFSIQVYTTGTFDLYIYDANFNMIKTIALTVKEHQYDNGTVVQNKNCVQHEITAYTCVKCGNKDYREGSDYGDHSWNDYYSEDQAATCTVDGFESQHCANCNAKRNERTIPALGHKMGAWEVVNPSTCENPGLEQRYCERCDYTESRGLDPNGHEWQDSLTIDQEATCIEDGSKSRHCKNCDAKTDVEVIPAKGHDLTHYDAKPATCTETGHVAYDVCLQCDYRTECIEIPATGHTWEHITNSAGLLKNGNEYDECSVCGEKQNEAILAGYATYYVKSFKLAKGKKCFTAKWSKQSAKNQKKFNGYQIRYSTKSNMSGAKTAIASKSSKSKKISKLKAKKKYYVQVRTYTKKNGTTFYSKWSSKKSVTTK